MDSIEEDFEERWPFGGEGDADDVPIPTGPSCVKISEILASADETAGEYSFGGVADSLPVAPGFFVDGVGAISLPLVPEQAEKLISKCEKSPFGHNMDTKMDENVRKSWQLSPNQVKINNTQWTSGIDELAKIISKRLGYEDIPLQCLLHKVLVYEEGGHFVKHQDTEKEDGMIATLVVQPPSTHEGGDLAVYRGGKERYRHDFGKADGTAAYLTHYAVHYADAEHELEKVTKGHRLVLVYSICLPPNMHHLERDLSLPTSDDLADAISEMNLNNEAFALLLSHEYTKKSVEKLGSGALKGIDSARFRALKEANAVVPEDKKLRFFLVKLSHKIVSGAISAFDDTVEEYELVEVIHWYSTGGEALGPNRDKKATSELNFLNPGQETFQQLWETCRDSKENPYTGNEGPTTETKYSRFAIVAWPGDQHAENALKSMSVDLAVEELLDKRPVDAAALREFLDVASTKMGSGKFSGGKDKTASVRFCRSFCELLVDAGDSKLAQLFFSKYCPRFGELTDNTTLISGVTKVVRTFDWGDIVEAMLNVLGRYTDEYQEEDFGDTALEMTLQVVDGLDDGPARQAPLKLAVELAIKSDNDDSNDEQDGEEKGGLSSSKVLGILWKFVISSDKDTFDSWLNHVNQKDPSNLAKMVETFSQYGDLDETTEKLKALTSVASRRMTWLKQEIQALDTTFSWNMPNAQFPDNKLIEDFLRGPEVSMKTEGVQTFSDLPEALKYASKCVREDQNGASFTMKPAGEDVMAYVMAYVTVTKTRKWFNNCQKELIQHRAELEELQKIYEGTIGPSKVKKCRRE